MDYVTFKPIITENDLFKAQYNKYMRRASIIAVILTILFFWLSPKYVPNPYKIYEDKFEVVDMAEAVDIPPPPQETPKPAVNIEVALDSEVDEDVEIADTLLDSEDVMADMFGDGSDAGGEEFQVSQEKPVLTQFISPDYPEMARASQLEGTVVVKVQVGPDGSVLQAVVLTPVHPLLDKEAVKAAKRCKFQPGRQRGIAVKAWMAIPFAFRLH
ncbi:MAG: energy transducer TonB [bacterium]|nr:energy transducer TonB [bacterium]